jgi:hypothetical protein
MSFQGRRGGLNHRKMRMQRRLANQLMSSCVIKVVVFRAMRENDVGCGLAQCLNETNSQFGRVL